MAGKPNSRNWNDVQTAIATAAIVTTLGLWNLFATPSKTKVTQASEPTTPPTEPPLELAPATIPVPTAMPHVKIMFAAGATPQASLQSAPSIQQVQPVKKKNRNNGGGGGGGGTVTQTKTS